MRKLLPLIQPLALLLCLLFSHHLIAQKKYNIIYIGIDDMSAAFDAYNNPIVPCPNIARLASHGTFFKRAYAMFPLCSPSRTSMLSGKRPDTTGVVDNDRAVKEVLGQEFDFLNEFVRDAGGYHTIQFGKAICEHEPEITWDSVYPRDRDGTNGGLGFKPAWWIDSSNETLEEREGGFYTKGLLNALISPPASPYFYNLGLSTHNAFVPSLETWNMLGDPVNPKLLPVDKDGTLTNVFGNGSGNIPLPNTPVGDKEDIPKFALKNPLLSYSEDWQRDLRHAYYAEMLEVDYHLGAVLDRLDSLNLWDSTIVVFFSDHGLNMGEHEGNYLKMTLFNETLHVPLLIAAPGYPGGNVCNQLVELVDVFPTLVELTGIVDTTLRDGTSLVPLLENPNAEWKKVAHSQISKTSPATDSIMGRALFTQRYHYNNWQEAGEELYDLTVDSFEYTNLAINHPEALDSLNMMRSLFNQGWTAHKPPVYTKSVYYKDNDGDGYGNSLDSIVRYFTPAGYAALKGDCNDANASVNPGVREKPCNNLDDNCRSGVDENRPEPTITALGNLDICMTDSVKLRSDAVQGATFQWMINSVNIPGATERVYTAKNIGNYKVKVTAPNGCSNESKSVKVISSCQNQKVELMPTSRSSMTLAVTPNPVKDNFILLINSNVSGNTVVHIVNANGINVHSQQDFLQTGLNKIPFNISLPTGLYKIEINGYSTTFVVE
jgi:uncharacterized sulfatase